MMENEGVQIGPLARAYVAAVRAGQISREKAEEEVFDGASYILRHGVAGTTVDVLRVVAALCEAVAQLKDEESENERIEQQTPRRSTAAPEENAEPVH